MQQPWYCTREQVQRALDTAETARNSAQIDRAIAAASRSIEQQMHRQFAPWTGTRYFGFPKRNHPSWKLWLDGSDLISVTSLTSAGTTISSSDYFLEPVNVGPPYTSIEIDQSSSAVFAAGDTAQRSIAITGLFGYWDELEEVATLSQPLTADASDATSLAWSYPDRVGVGSILKVDSERLIVTDMTFVDTTQNTSQDLTASAADNSITVFNVDEFFPGEVIRIDVERMLVVDRGTTSPITVKRAWDGSVLATHAGTASIYAKTGAQVDRAQLGTTIAAHAADATVYRWVVPPLINDLCVAEAVVQLQQEQSAYPRATSGGSGDFSVTQPAGAGLRALREQVYAAFGRKARTYAI